MSTRTILIGRGEFGLHVNRLLAAGAPDRETRDPGWLAGPAGPGPGPTAVAVSLWRPENALLQKVDDASRRSGWSWLPVVMAHPYLRIGPLVVPGQAPCYRCYRGRAVQHDRQFPTTSILERAYASDAECGPAGYLPHHARLAASIADGILRGLSPAGRVHTVNLLTQQTGASVVIACHGCDRCRPAHRIGQPAIVGGPLERLILDGTLSPLKHEARMP